MTYAVKAVRLFVFSRRCVARTKVHGVAKGKKQYKDAFLGVHTDMIVADIAGKTTPKTSCFVNFSAISLLSQPM